MTVGCEPAIIWDIGSVVSASASVSVLDDTNGDGLNFLVPTICNQVSRIDSRHCEMPR